MAPPSWKTLLIIPTYNEAGNIETLIREILDQRLELDLLVIDDNSPDGTGHLAERLSRSAPITVIHRAGKLGIGSAHKQGLQYALDHGYLLAITMDADFSHSPRYLGDLLRESARADVVVGSRYIRGGGLVGWSLFRLLITHTAHTLTTLLLGIPYDCTGAFRIYRSAVLREVDFQAIRSEGYAFLIEMICEVCRSGFAVGQIPIVISKRHKGVSKISHSEILKAVKTLFHLGLRRRRAAPPVTRVPEKDRALV